MEYREVAMYTKSGVTSPWTYKEINIKQPLLGGTETTTNYDRTKLNGHINMFYKNNTIFTSGLYASGTYDGEQNDVSSNKKVKNYIDLDIPFIPQVVYITTIDRIGFNYKNMKGGTAIIYPQLGIGYWNNMIFGTVGEGEGWNANEGYNSTYTVEQTRTGIRIITPELKNPYSIRGQSLNDDRYTYSYVALG